MGVRLYLVFIEQHDTTIWDNQVRLMRKHRAVAHINYECQVRITGGWLDSFLGHRYDLYKPMIGKRDDLQWVRQYMQVLMTDQDGKLITRGHGGLNSYGTMGPECFADFLIDMGLNKDIKIDLTGCSLARGPNVAPDAVHARTATAVGEGSYAHRFQRALFQKRGLRCRVHARTFNFTINEAGRKETRDPVTNSWVHKAPYSKIIFTINSGGRQTMEYAEDEYDTYGIAGMFSRHEATG